MNENPDFRPTLSMGSLKSNDHICLIYEKSSDRQQCISAYFRNGLDHNERLIYITSSGQQPKVTLQLQKSGFPLKELIDANKIHFEIRESLDGCGNKEFFIWLTGEVEQSLRMGFSGIRIAVDSDQYFNNLESIDNLLRQTVFFHQYLNDKPYIILCQYQRKKVPANFLLQVIKTHPILVIDNEMYRNFYYIPAEDLLSEKSAEKEMEQWINQLKDYKLYAATLRESERKLSTMIDNLPGAAYRCLNNRNWTMLFISHGITNLTGYTPHEIINDRHISYNKMIHPDDRKMVWETIQSSIDKKKSFQIIYRITGKDGGATWIWEQGRLVGESSDGTGILEGLLTDISEQKKIENELTRAKEKAEESDRLKSAFLANMSHEIRTPLNGILGFTELLAQDKISKEQKDRYKTIVQSSAEQLLTIINDILDLSKIESRQLSISIARMNLAAMIDELTEKTEYERKRLKKEHVDFVLDLPPDFNEIFLHTDSHRLKQILMNLLGNAFKFTFNGKVEFGFRIDPSMADNDKPRIIFHVRDTGIGIPKEMQSVIFQRFRQAENTPARNPGGTGLGLSICKGLLDLLGGEIMLDSVAGEGTSVSIVLPLTQTEENEELPDVIEKYGDKIQGKRILIVEDNEVNRLFFKEVLKDKGAEIVMAETGSAAMKILAKGIHFDLALIDIKLPDISGLEIIRKIKNQKMPVPVIAQTAYANSDEVDKCFDAGCDAYLPKPINKGELYIVINRML